MTLSWLDRAIVNIAPGYGLRRARHKLAAQQMLSYVGADPKVNRSWRGATGASARAEISTSNHTLRDRARHLVRNNPLAASGLRERVRLLVGYGVTPRPLNKAQAAWMRECDADGISDFHGLIVLAVQCMIESGEVIVRFRRRRPSDMAVPLQLQVLEPDFLDSSKTEKFGTNGETIVNGVHLDALGRRKGYWLFDQHPGDNFLVSGSSSWRSSKFYPADDVIHVFFRNRPGQLRGVTDFSPVIADLKDLDDYDAAERMRKKIEACLTAFVTRPEGIDGGTLAPYTTDSDGKRTEEFGPGQINYLRPGESVDINAPSGGDGYSSFTTKQERRIASGLGVTYEGLTGDLSQVNYSSYRAGEAAVRSSVEQQRWTTIVPMLLDPIWKAAADTAAAVGVDWPSAEWMFPKWPSVDPVKDVAATQAAIRNGLMTWRQAIAELGYDSREQLAEMELERREMDAAGVILDCDPRYRTVSGGNVNANSPIAKPAEA